MKTKFDLNPKLTCLIGINGVGKSNILNALQLFKKTRGDRYSRSIKEFRKQYGFETSTNIQMTLNDNGKDIYIKGDIFIETDDKNNDEVKASFLKINLRNINGNGKWIDIIPEAFELYRHHPRQINERIFFYYDTRQIDCTRDDIKIIISVVKYLKHQSYYSASQFSDPTKCPISIEIEDHRLGRSNLRSSTHEIFLSDLYFTYKNNKKTFEKFISTVNTNGIGLINDLRFDEVDIPSNSYKVKSGGKILKIERSRQIIVPCIDIDGYLLSPNQLSEGTFKTLALVFYILTDENRILLIEEPEVCVHHGLLNSVLSLILDNENKQIIISTHSDFVLDKLSPENIVIVKKEKGKGTTASKLTTALSKNDYQALKIYLTESGNLGEYWKEGGFENE